MIDLIQKNLEKSAIILKNAKHATAFTGAGISVESGIPPFRGDGGIWGKYDPKILELGYFLENPEESWIVIKEIFYEFFNVAKPNYAHLGLADLEKRGIIKALITQNIDNLHQEAGSKNVIEFHGNSKILICTNCSHKEKVENVNLEKLPPKCPQCKSLMKPDFIFFGEGIPQIAYQKSIFETKNADVFLLTGTSGSVVPASYLPYDAKKNGAIIIEINPEKSAYTNEITDYFLKGKAAEITKLLIEKINLL
jgi:NAD-dependent deacetylase